MCVYGCECVILCAIVPIKFAPFVCFCTFVGTVCAQAYGCLQATLDPMDKLPPFYKFYDIPSELQSRLKQKLSLPKVFMSFNKKINFITGLL